MLLTRWEQVKAVFLETADLPRAEQQGAVEALCTGDAALATEVLSLLKEDATPHALLDMGIDQLVGALLEGDVAGLEGRQLGPYRLLRLLGEGGMGVVFLAERADIGQQVAIKLLRHAWMSPARRERFLQEQRLLAQLNHPHIARIYDADTLPDGTSWFAMEYVEGQTLTLFLAEAERDLARDLELYQQVCDAVRYAHGRAIIHRDLKPGNVLVTAEGQARLLDFGVAKQLAEAAEDALTQDGTQLLTPAYAAPEQVHGGALGTFTDVYALGVILFELLTGRLPVPARMRHRGDTPPRPSMHRHESPHSSLRRREWADMDALCMTALEFEPEQRYGSIYALLADLRAFLDGRPLKAHAGSWTYRSGKFCRRHRAALLSAAAVLLVLATLATVFTVRLAHAKNAALAELARRERLQHFTESLFDGGDAEAGRAQDLTTVQLLKRGEAGAENLRGDPATQAELLGVVGHAYQQLGRLGNADPLLQQAVDDRRRLASADPDEYANSLVSLGLLRQGQSRLNDAEFLLQRAVATERQVRAAAHLDRALWALGSVRMQHGEYSRVEPLFNEARQIDQQPGHDRIQLAEDLASLGDLHFYRNEFPAAIALDQEALGIYRNQYGESHPTVAQVLDSLAQIQENLGHNTQAEALFHESLAIRERWYGPNHPVVAESLDSLALVESSLGRSDEARAMLTRALEIQTRSYGPNHSAVALTLNQRGVLAYKRQDWKAAEADYLEALSVWRSLYGEHHQFVGVAYANLAGVYLNRKELPQAEAMARKALAVYQLTLPPGHSNIMIVRLKLGRILLHEGRYTEAEPETLAALRYFTGHEAQYPSYLPGAQQDWAQIEAKLGKATPSGQGKTHGL